MAFKIDMRRYNFMRNYTAPRLNDAIAHAGVMYKLVCGVVNGVAYLVMMDARDKMLRYPGWGGKLKHAYGVAFNEYNAYIRALKYPASNMPRFFHLQDMSESTRKHFGDITDEQYFEFWEGCAGTAYEKHRPFITSLANKYRLSLIRHGNQNAEILQWPMAAQAMVELAVTLWEVTTEDMSEKYELPVSLLKKLFAGFGIQRVAAAWKKALNMTEPKIDKYELESDEERNIELGILQLSEVFSEPQNLYDSLLGSVEAYDEIFRTKGEFKKVVKEIKEIKSFCNT